MAAEWADHLCYSLIATEFVLITIQFDPFGPHLRNYREPLTLVENHNLWNINRARPLDVVPTVHPPLRVRRAAIGVSQEIHRKSYLRTIGEQIDRTAIYETSNSAPGVFLASFSSKVNSVNPFSIAVAAIKASGNFIFEAARNWAAFVAIDRVTS